jgi:hypothetical protein
MILKKIKNRARGWRPLVLHWRRRRSVRPILRPNRVSSSVSISYFPQIHLHFTTLQIRNSSMTRVSAGSTVSRERVLFERRVETRTNTDRNADRPLVHRPLRINYVNAPRFSKTLSFYSLSKQSAPIRQVQQPRASASFTSVFTTRQSSNRAELNKVFQTHSHISDRRTQVLSYRSASHETLLKSDRAEELVWRRAQSRTTVSEDVPVANVTQTSQQQTLRTPAVSTHVQTASSSSNQTTSPQITKLDPALVDRLTDDVIRRVEKRARVERQRRGL